MKLALYDTSTGRILQINMGGSVDEVLALCAAGQGAVPVNNDVDDGTHHIVYGEPQLIPVAVPTLDELKADKWAEIKLAREAEVDSDLVTPFGSFNADERSRRNISDAVLMLQTLTNQGTSTTIDYTLANNSTVTLTTVQMVNVGLLLGQKVQTAFAKGRALRGTINAATTAAEVEAVSWITG